MSNSAIPSKSVRTTKTVGYFNSNKWSIHLAISELNISLQMKPGEFILDKQGRKINDPFFDKYCGPLRLSKEEADQPVEVITVPKLESVQQRFDGHAVGEVTEFTHDRKGIRQPVMPKPRPAMLRPDQNKSPVTPMTMEEARRAGLVRQTRSVPEDYGATDTTGAPPPGERIPPIKYATDTTGAGPAKPKPLPKPLTKPVTKAASAVIQKLEEAAQSDPEDAGFLNRTLKGLPDLPRPNIPGAEAVEASDVEPEGSAAETEDAGMEAGVPSDGDGAETTSDENEAEPDSLPEPPLDEDEQPLSRRNLRPAMPKSVKPFVCSVDGVSFRYRSELMAHAKRKFSKRVDEIMEPYPEE